LIRKADKDSIVIRQDIPYSTSVPLIIIIFFSLGDEAEGLVGGGV
jgi:hypothetical protein